MGKFLFWIIVLGLAWMVLRYLVIRGRSVAPTEPAAPAQAPAEAMLQCAWCGVHMPASESVSAADGRVYCGREHLDAARNAAGS